jgi:hypothetical protein
LVMAAIAAFTLPFVFAFQQSKVDQKDALIDSLKNESIRLALKKDPSNLVEENAVLKEVNRFLFQQKLVPGNSINIPDRISFTQESIKSPARAIEQKDLTATLLDSIRQLKNELQKQSDRNRLSQKQLSKLDSTLVVFSKESSDVAIKLIELCAIVKYNNNRNERTWSRKEIDRLQNYLNNLCGVTENWRTSNQQPRRSFFRFEE